MDYHNPVLLQESIDALNITSEGTYVDATFGGGGHSMKILERLNANGHLFGFDQDEDVLANLPENDNFTFVHHNFRYLKRFLKFHGVKQVDSILADLGVSSHQLNQADRGFSYRFDAELDMRMNQQGDVKAHDILNTYSKEELQQIFSAYGEVRNAKTLAQTIVEERKQKRLKTIGQFLQMLEPIIRGNKPKYLAQVFQAIRIEVNDEVGALKDFLTDSLEVLKPGGRLVVISYHSLEDRLVKNLMRSGSFEKEYIKDDFGNIYRPFKIITKKAIAPTQEELKRNSRSRSARLRIAEKK